MYSIPFQQLDKQAFLSQYWQKKPCVFNNAFADFPNFLSPEQLAGLSLEEDIESRLIQFNPALQQWQLSHGPFASEDYSQLPDSNWTLLVQSVDSWIAETRALLEHFNFIPKWRFDDLMVSYATDQGGVGPHFDNFDVFLIQGSGKRRWRVGEPGQVGQQMEVANGLFQLADFTPTIDIVLSPGDMLYVPPKTAHWSISCGPSIGYSVGYRTPETKQLLTLLTEDLHESNQSGEFFSDKYRQNPIHNNQLDEQLVIWAQSQLKNLSEDPDRIRRLLSRQLSLSKLGVITDENHFEIQSVIESSLIQLDTQLTPVCYRRDDKIVVSIEGEDFIFEKYLITAVEKLVNFAECPIKLFKKSPNAVDFPEDLANLVNRGYVKRVK